MYHYAHGGNAVYEKGGGHIIDLSANINPLGTPENVREAVINELPRLSRYPDSFSTALREAIASFENVEKEQIFCGNGASDIIFRLPRAAAAKKVAVTSPCFSDYERAANAFGCQIVRHRLLEENAFSVDKRFSERVEKERPELVFLCSPNNPTGSLTSPHIIEDLLMSTRAIGAVLAVDECFIDFSAKAAQYTSKAFLKGFPNLVILKAFTKLFALPGIRLGYAICADKALVDRLYQSGADWPVSNLAQAAGEAALIGGEGYIKRSVEYVSKERRKMEAGLSALGYNIFPSEANYIFIKSPFSFDLYDKLNQNGIRIRSCGSYRSLNGSYYRIAVSTQENNERLLDSVDEVTNKWKQEQKTW